MTARLRGHLTTYHLERAAQAVLALAEGVRRVVDLVEIACPAGRPAAGRTAAARRVKDLRYRPRNGLAVIPVPVTINR